MNKLLIPILLLLCAGTALAQSAPPAMSDQNGTTTVVTPSAEQKEAEKQADRFCLRETGTHLRAITTRHSQRAVECATSSPGRTYTREDLDRTGAISVADALRKLDPAIH